MKKCYSLNYNHVIAKGKRERGKLILCEFLKLLIYRLCFCCDYGFILRLHIKN